MKMVVDTGWTKSVGFILWTALLSCEHPVNTSSTSASGNNLIKSMVELEGSFKDMYKKVFAIKSENLQNATISEWPHKGDYYPAFSSFNSGLADEFHQAAKKTMDEIPVFRSIKNLAYKYNVTAYLGGLSATRVAYQGALGVRRQHGDHRISPYRVSNSFGELFPLEQSVLDLVVDGDSSSAIESFGNEVTELLKPIVEVSVMNIEAFDKSKGSLTNSCSQALIPLETRDWDPMQLGNLSNVLNYGVLNEPVKGDQPLNYDEITEVLACLSLFDLSPTKELKEKLKYSINLTQNEQEMSAKSALMTYGMLWEMRHIYRFRPLLKELGWDNSPMIKSYQNLPDTGIRRRILDMIDKKPMDLGLSPIKWSTSFDKLEPTKAEGLKFNHAVKNTDALVAISRNPYGLPNGYISRRDCSKEMALFGDGLYTYNSWTKTYYYKAVYMLATPTNVLFSSMCRNSYRGGCAILNNASFFYVVDPKPAFDDILEKSFAQGMEGYYKMKQRYLNAYWQRDLFLQDFFGGNIARAEKLAWWLHKSDDRDFDKMVTSYFDCSDSGCKVKAKFQEILGQKAKPPKIIKRAVLKTKLECIRLRNGRNWVTSSCPFSPIP